MNFRAGISMVALIAVLGVLVLAGAGYWYVSMRIAEPSCTEEAKICPDGSAVGRTGPNCSFASCPEIGEISGEDCRARGGEVVNTLGIGVIPEKPIDYSPADVLGEIRGANCPCVCVKRTASSTGSDDHLYQRVIAEFLTQWPEIQKTVPFKPVLGATAWHVTAFEFLAPTSFVVAFEDGHVAAAAFYRADTPSGATETDNPFPFAPFRFSREETISPDDFPLSVDAWYALLVRHGGSSDMAKTFVTSVVRGTEVITFNGWVEVPENPFVRVVPGGVPGARKAVKPVVPTTEPDCVRVGGAWGRQAFFDGCTLRTGDGGMTCTDGAECEGECLAASATATAGRCTSVVPVSGCNYELNAGSARGALTCRD